MHVARTLADFGAWRNSAKGVIGFVPTMGYLHEGHLSLVRRARARCDVVIASIFVNPTQFAPTEDLSSYPRDLDRDLALLRGEGVDGVLAPEDHSAFYPEGFDTWVQVGAMTQRLEGASRPTHFRGVTTIVAKLFNTVQPDVAFFGQKDAQQALVIRRMIRDLDFGIELVLGPTVREPDGLAMSSRNAYLNPEERKAATVLRRALDAAESLWNEGVRSGDGIRDAMAKVLEGEPLAEPDYVSVASLDTLEELDHVETTALVSLAVRIGKPRLIDNCVLPPGKSLL
jgi:pantoate--beta-alanine ligase